MKRFVAFLLSIALLVNTIPIQTFATEVTDESVTSVIPPVLERGKPEIIGEDTELRDENIKQFLQDDGSVLVCQYPQPVHYKQDDKWVDIDNSLMEMDENEVVSEDIKEELEEAVAETSETTSQESPTIIENKKNDVKIMFSNKAKKSNMIQMKFEDYHISWGIVDAKNKPTFEIIPEEDIIDENPTSLKNITSSGIYQNVFEDVDLRYTLMSKSIKEDIILNNETCNNTFVFSYQLKGLEMRTTAEGSIELYDSENTEKVVYVIDKPYMYDSAEKPMSSDDITMELSGKNKKYTITITADKTWLTEKERVYPVVIDPTLHPDTNAHNIKDATRAVNPAISAENRAHLESEDEKMTMKVGTRYGTELQALIYFNIPSVIPSSAKIVNAQMATYLLERSNSEMQVNAHIITSDWNTGVIDVNTVLYGNSPSYNQDVVDYKIFTTSSEHKYYLFDITSAVQKWTTGICPNYGILLSADTVPASTNYIRFVDSDLGGNCDPQYLFTYRDNKGLEDYWTYHTQDVGKAGTGYISDYSGNLVFIHNDVTTTSERMSITLDHVFDQSRLLDTATYLNSVSPKYGNGWRLSAVQRLEVTQSEKIKQTYPYYYIDADGTEHYFKDNNNGTFSDEDGLGLTLQLINEYTDNNATLLSYSITSKDKITMKFDSNGYLRRISDTNTNTICFNYTSNCLTSIIDPSGRTVTLNYDAGSKLTSIVDFSGNSTSYNYNEYGQLSNISYSDGRSVLYTYDNVNCIDTVQDVEVSGSGRYKIDYNLYHYAPYRVSSVTEYGTDSQQGQSISSIIYEHNQTIFTDNKGRNSIYQFDNWGCTTSIIDNEGNASNYSYEHDGNKNNKFSSTGTSQKNINNYVLNSSAEENSAWTEFKKSTGSLFVDGNASYDNGQAYLGNTSLKSTSNNNEETKIMHAQEITLPAGNYTLSAYVKTQNVQSEHNGGATLSVSYKDNNNDEKWVNSTYTNGTNDWERMSLTFLLNNSTNTFKIYVGLINASGTAYFDCIQLEDGEAANDYNLLQNSSFEHVNGTVPLYWNQNGDGISSTETAGKHGLKTFKMNGSAAAAKSIKQSICVNGSEGDIYSVSGWTKGCSVALTDNITFRIMAKINYSDGTFKSESHDFNSCVEEWQFLSAIISTDDKNASTQKTYTSIEISICYDYNENTVYIDHLQVTKDNCQSYEYDNDGNLISSADLADKESTFEYQDDMLKKMIDIDGTNYEYSYGCDSKNLLLAARTGGGVSYKFGYNMNYGYGTTNVAQISGGKYSNTIIPGKVYYIRNRETGKNIQSYNCGSGNGTNIVQYEPSVNQFQKWWVKESDDGYYYFELADASSSKLCVKNGYAARNQPLELSIHISDATKFKLVPNSDGVHYSIRPKLNDSMAVCSNLGSTANNNQILLYPYEEAGLDKEWYFVEVDQSDYIEPELDNTYYITNHLTSQYFDIPTFRSNVGCEVTQHAYLGGTNQQFNLESTGDYCLLVPQHCTHMALSVGSDGTSLTLQTKNESDTKQQFAIVELGNGAYRIIPRDYPNKTISQSNTTSIASGWLYILEYTGELWQEWRFTKPIDFTTSAMSEDGEIYYIRFNHNYQYMDVPTMREENGTPLTQYPFNSMLNQQFRLTATEDGYYTIRPMHTNKNIVLTLALDPNFTDGTGNIILTEPNNSVYQEFKFIPTSNNTYRMVCKASNSEGYCTEIPNGINTFSAHVRYVPFVGNGANWQWLTLEKVGDVIRTSATYSNSKNYVSSITDAAGNTTHYDYNDNNGELKSVTDATGTTTKYTYDNSNRLSSVTTDNSNVGYNYYSNSALEKILSPSGTAYNFLYDTFGNIKKIQIGSRTLIEHEYNDNNGTLRQSTYGNGTTIKYQYDSFDYLKQKLYNDTVITEYTYDAQGRVYNKKDNLTGETIQFLYDFIDRTTSIVSSNGLKQTYSYDNKNRIESYTSTIGNISQKTGFLYGKDTTFGINLQKPGYLYGVTLNGSQTLAYEYDSLSRMTTKRIDGANHYKTNYEYYQGPNNEGTSQTTTMLSSVTNGETNWEYTYDELGNIISISKDGVVQESYTYDNLNQLKTVTRGSDVWEYSYDNGGNLTAVKQNGTAIKTYQYGDSEWKDLLTSYNNQNLTYDTIGNPLQYRDGYNFTWQNGRQLATITKGTDSISYAYNSDGLRTSKTVNGTTTEYYWLEGSLLGEKTGNEYIIYLYDDNGSAYGVMITDGTEETYYYYLFNAQGDIIGIVDSSGNQVVEYTYNAWGEIISITGTEAETIGQKNPLRYRGYYYDAETGFYYVSSRYYDSEIGRFLNADGQVANVGGDILGYNMFAYCMNNPVNMSDPTGNWPKWIRGALNVVSGVTQMIAGAALGATVGWTGIGAVAAGFLIANGAGTATKGVGQIVNDVADKKVLREDNIIKTTVKEIGQIIGDDKGKKIAGGAYDIATIAANIYVGKVGLQQAGLAPIKVNVNNLINNPFDEFVSIGPANGVIDQYRRTIPQRGYGKIYATYLSNGKYFIANGHHRVAALKFLGVETIKIYLTK